MNKTRRGFLAALAMLPGVVLFRRSRPESSSTCSSNIMKSEYECTPDYGGFKFDLGQRLRRKDDGHEGIVVQRAERLTDRQTLATTRSYTLVTDEGLGEWCGFGGPEDTFEAAHTWYVYRLEC